MASGTPTVPPFRPAADMDVVTQDSLTADEIERATLIYREWEHALESAGFTRAEAMRLTFWRWHIRAWSVPDR